MIRKDWQMFLYDKDQDSGLSEQAEADKLAAEIDKEIKEDIKDLMDEGKEEDEAPVVVEEKEESKEVEEKVEEKKEEVEEKKGEEEETKSEQDLLLAELNRLAGALQTPPTTVKKEEKKEEVPPVVEEKKEETVEKDIKDSVQDFLTSDEFKDTFNPEEIGKFNKVLNKVVEHVKSTIAATQPQQVIPDIGDQVAKSMEFYGAATDFWRNNQDLIPHLDYVRFKLNEVKSKNENISNIELFKTVEEEVRKVLPQKENEGEKDGGQDPALADTLKSTNQRNNKSNQLTETQKEIKELMDLEY